MSSTKRRAAVLALAAVVTLAVAAGGWALAGSGQPPKPGGERPAAPGAKPVATAEAGVQVFSGTLLSAQDRSLVFKGMPRDAQATGQAPLAGWMGGNSFAVVLSRSVSGSVEMMMTSGVVATQVSLPKATRYALNHQECREEDLTEGMLVTVRVEKGPTGEAQARVNALYRDPEFIVQAIDPAKRTVQLVVPGSRAPVLEYTLPETAAVTSGGKPSSLAEVKRGTKVALELTPDGKTVRGLRMMSGEQWAFAP
jgi:hypothetical protein